MSAVTEGVEVLACTACGFRSVTDTSACPWCGEPTVRRTVAGAGVVWSHTLVHLPFEGYADGYRLVYVDLDDGARILAHQGPEAAAPRIGARVLVRPTGAGRYELEEAR